MVRWTPAQMKAAGINPDDGEPMVPQENRGESKWKNTERVYRKGLAWDFEEKVYKTQILEFGSGAESRRYAELELAAQAGVILFLVPHRRWQLEIITGIEPGDVGRYDSDAVYYERDPRNPDHVVEVVEDVKAKELISRDYPLRKLLMQRIYGIHIREIDAADYREERHTPRAERSRGNGRRRGR